MGETGNAQHTAVTCREMTADDNGAVVALLTRGFAAWREGTFWEEALRRMAEREVPAGLPRFGYVLEAGGGVVGVLLVIAWERVLGGDRVLLSNVSSWYVEPAYRLYGSLLVRKALQRRDVTYLNVTPAPETWTLLSAQGYRRYAAGRAVGLPLLARGCEPARVEAQRGPVVPGADLQAGEAELLAEHARWGCLVLVCHTEAGRVPFVFGVRRRKGVVPFAYLIYGRSLDSLAAYARPLGRALARRGMLAVVYEGDGRSPSIPGWFQDGHPKFCRGERPPGPHDLSFTERAIFGV